ncbi:MAG: CotH kinase family protein [Treponema sp.]
MIANYSDKTLLRNKFVSILGTEILNASWNPSFVSVDVVMNGEYWGNYIFCEKISIGDGRIEIKDITDVEEKLAAGKGNKVTDANDDGATNLEDGGIILMKIL